MAKTDKAIPEGEPIVEAAPAAEETFEQRDERLKREDYQRRNLQEIKEREEIYRRNKVIAPDEPFTMDPNAAVNQRCCS
jgi:hypothetical protein